MPAVVEYGPGCIRELGKHLIGKGQRAFLVCGHSAINHGFVSKIEKILQGQNVECIVYGAIAGEPTDRVVNRGIQEFKKANCDLLIGLGGGSALDAMKAIGAGVSLDCDFRGLIGHAIEVALPCMVAIPTTAGTGSEATTVSVITDTRDQKKLLIVGPSLLPDVAIVDPEFTLTTPSSTTMGTALDAFTHAVEGLTSRFAQPLTDTLAIDAIKRILNSLPIALEQPDNLEARTDLSLAALEAGVVINNSTVTLVHGLSRPLGAKFHVPHGMANALLLEECLRFAAEGAVEPLARLERSLQNLELTVSEKEAAEMFLDRLHEFLARCEVPSLSTLGVRSEEYRAQISTMAADALASGSVQNTRKVPTSEEVERIYLSLCK